MTKAITKFVVITESASSPSSPPEYRFDYFVTENSLGPVAEHAELMRKVTFGFIAVTVAMVIGQHDREVGE